MAGHNLVTALFDEQGQVELFGDGDFRCPLSNLPAPAVKVDGGYVVSGGWDYSSGCDVATHFIGGAVIVPRRATSRSTLDGSRYARDQYEIIDNWNTLGMRGTGSRRVVVENLFIPEHHTVPSPNPERRLSSSPVATCTRTRSTAPGRSCRCSSRSRRRWRSVSPRPRSTSTSRCSRPAISTAPRRRSAPT